MALGEQSSAVTTDILPLLVVDTDPDVRCEVSFNFFELEPIFSY